MAKNTKLALTLSLVIFLFIFVVHLLRVIFGWHAQIGDLVIPVWISIIAFVIAGLMIYTNYRAL